MRELYDLLKCYEDGHSSDWMPAAFIKGIPLTPAASLEILEGHDYSSAMVYDNIKKVLGRETGENETLRCFDLAVNSSPFDGNSFRFWFNSAWIPSVPIAEYISKRWPELSFHVEFTEEGEFFCGCMDYDADRKEDGVDYRDYDWPKECLSERDTEDMVEDFLSNDVDLSTKPSYEEVQAVFLKEFADRGCSNCNRAGTEVCEIMKNQDTNYSIEDFLPQLKERYVEKFVQ